MITRKPEELNLTSFTIFRVAPAIIIEEGKSSPDTPQHCTRGHAWNFGFSFVGVELDLEDLGLTDGPEKFCALCLRDLLRLHCGKVKDGVKR